MGEQRGQTNKPHRLYNHFVVVANSAARRDGHHALVLLRDVTAVEASDTRRHEGTGRQCDRRWIDTAVPGKSFCYVFISSFVPELDTRYRNSSRKAVDAAI